MTGARGHRRRRRVQTSRLGRVWLAARMGDRVFHPHVLYEVSDGTLFLDVLEVAGATSAGSVLPGWRALRIEQLSDIVVHDTTFIPSREINLSAPKYRKIIAHCLGT